MVQKYADRGFVALAPPVCACGVCNVFLHFSLAFLCLAEHAAVHAHIYDFVTHNVCLGFERLLGVHALFQHDGAAYPRCIKGCASVGRVCAWYGFSTVAIV
jgi:hypothetical protein